MEITDSAELKLIEKYREILGKRQIVNGPAISREFSLPSQLDSDDTMYIGVYVRIGSSVPVTTETELRAERNKTPEKYRSSPVAAARVG